MSVVFIVGEPGAGKTSAIRHLIEECSKYTKPKWTIGKERCFAGHYLGEKFDGGDTVAYNGVADALEFWSKHLSKKAVTVLDGDRFSNEKALRWFEARAPTFVILLRCTGTVAAARRKARGTVQNPVWLRGRKTKAENFYNAAKCKKGIIDTSIITPLEVAGEISRRCGLREFAPHEKLFPR